MGRQPNCTQQRPAHCDGNSFPFFAVVHLCSSCNKHVRPGGVFMASHTHTTVHKPLTYRPPFLTRKLMGNLGFLPPPFPRTISLVSCLVQQLLVHKLVPTWENKERLKKETDHPRLVSGSFNKQENLCTRLILGGYKTKISSLAP